MGVLKQSLSSLKHLYQRNSTWKSAAAFLVLLVRQIPDWLGYKEFWRKNLPTVWHFIVDHGTLFTVLVVGAVIAIDHHFVLRGKKPKPHDPATLHGRALQLHDDLAAFMKELGPEPKLSVSMSPDEFSRSSQASNRRIDRLHHGWHLRFAERADRLWHEFGELGITDHNYTLAIAQTVMTAATLDKLMPGLERLAEQVITNAKPPSRSQTL